MFPMDGQLAAWKHELDRLMAANAISPRPQWSPLQVWVGTWNAANLEPPFDQLPLRAWLLGDAAEGARPTCDLYAIGFQELGGGGMKLDVGGGGAAAGASGGAARAAGGLSGTSGGVGGPAAAEGLSLIHI